jgi:hypothetical protein
MKSIKTTVLTTFALLLIGLGFGALTKRSGCVAAQSVRIEPGKKPTPKPATPSPTPRKPIANGTSREVAGTQFRHINRPENLKALFETIHNLIHVKKDAMSAVALFDSMIPNEERARKALRNDAPPESLQKILGMYRQFGLPGNADVNRLAKPEQTIVKVHGATTEEIARNEQGTVVFSEFPGGAVDMAGKILRPGLTFYEIEFLEPGKEYGIKYHLFFWDGRQWTMLGPVWRALR